MPTAALAPLAATIVNELPSLMERTLKNNAENCVMENQLVVLQAQIDNAKRNIAAERKVQHRLRDRIKAARGSHENTNTLSCEYAGTTLVI